MERDGSGKSADAERAAEVMPVVFVGHGNPMNAMEDNAFSRTWSDIGRRLPRPRAVLCVSAHWESAGTRVTAMENPRTIHDFGGFPKELFDVQYRAPGSPWLAEEVVKALGSSRVGPDSEWGLDHGCWSVLKRMYPEADVPVVQLSLDVAKTPDEHYAVGKALRPLRTMGVLVVGSGNLVHNLGRIGFPDDGPGDFNAPFGFDWALEANATFKRLIDEGRHAELCGYAALGQSVRLAVPTPEHFLPLLYVIAMKGEAESIEYFNDAAVAGSLTMTSLIVGKGRARE